MNDASRTIDGILTAARANKRQNRFAETNDIKRPFIQGSDNPWQRSKDDLSDDDVVYAIASIWLALGQSKYPYKLSFGPPETFKAFEGTDEDKWNSGSGRWLAPRTSDAVLLLVKRKDRMFLLACEPPGTDTNGNDLRIILLSGGPNQHDSDLIMKKVRKFFESRLWSAEGFEKKATFPESYWDWRSLTEPVEEQQEKLLIIIHAWAYMLDIPMKNGDLDKLLTIQRDHFFRVIELCVELSYEGKIDYTAIESVLRLSGFAMDQTEARSCYCIKETRYRQHLKQISSVFIAQEGIHDGDHLMDWPAYLDKRLGFWRSEASKVLVDPESSGATFEYEQEADYERVVFAIGVMWRARWQSGRPDSETIAFGRWEMYTAFAEEEADVKEYYNMAKAWPNRGSIYGHWNKSEVLLIPLNLDRDAAIKEIQGAQGTRHYILVLARRKGKEKTVEMIRYDSAAGTVSADRIEAAAKRIVLRGGWLGGKSGEKTGDIEIETCTSEAISPSQTGSWDCGIFAILNGWCAILDLRPVSNTKRRKTRPLKRETEFQRQALEIIDLACKGCMDEHTIVAFTQVFGYCEEKRFDKQRLLKRPLKAQIAWPKN